VVSGSSPLFNSYYLQACGEWLAGSTRAPGLTFCSGLSWPGPGPGLGCKFHLSSTASGASVGREHGAAGCIIRGCGCRDGCRDARGVCLAPTSWVGEGDEGDDEAAHLRLQNLAWVIGRYDGRGRIDCPRNSTIPLFHSRNNNNNNRGLPSKLGRKAKFAPPPPCHPAAHHTLPQRINVKHHRRSPQLAKRGMASTRARARDPCLALASLQPSSAPRTKLGVCVSLCVCSVLSALCSLLYAVCIRRITPTHSGTRPLQLAQKPLQPLPA
jgi:hypothetical protein